MVPRCSWHHIGGQATQPYARRNEKGPSEITPGPVSGGKVNVEVGLRCAFAEPGEVKLRYDLLEEPSGEPLYNTPPAHKVPERMTLEPLTLVAHLDEQRIAGTYVLGVSEDALAAVGMRLSAIPEGAIEPVVSETIGPQSTIGPFTIAVGGLAAGSYELRAELVRDGQVVATQSMKLVRRAGPFGVASPPING